MTTDFVQSVLAVVAFALLVVALFTLEGSEP